MIVFCVATLFIINLAIQGKLLSSLNESAESHWLWRRWKLLIGLEVVIYFVLLTNLIPIIFELEKTNSRR